MDAHRITSKQFWIFCGSCIGWKNICKTQKWVGLYQNLQFPVSLVELPHRSQTLKS